MKIREISDQVYKEFPELSYMSRTDFFQVWKSYETNIETHLYNPHYPYLQFLDIGTFSIRFYDYNKKIKNLKKTISFLDRTKIKNVDYIKLKNKALVFKNVLIEKQNFFKALDFYLGDVEIKNSSKIFINKIDVYLQEINNLIHEYDRRITTRNLEK